MISLALEKITLPESLQRVFLSTSIFTTWPHLRTASRLRLNPGRAPLGYFAERAPLGGGGQILSTHPSLARERVAVARRATRQWKVFDEYFLSNL